MSWNYLLRLKCILLPEYIDFMKDNRLSYFYETTVDEQESEYQALPKRLQDLVDIFKPLHIHHFINYSVEGNLLSFTLSNDQDTPSYQVIESYETFLHDIIVPITSEILECVIEPDDYRYTTFHYSDAQLRHIPFSLQANIKQVEHHYSEDGNEILWSRIVYKRSIPRRLFLDLHRAYSHDS